MTARTWFPTPDRVAGARMTDLCAAAGVPDRSTLDQWSRADPAGFWTLVHEWLGITWRTPPSSVVDRLDDPAHSVWFPGGRLSLVDCAVTRWIDEGRGEETVLSWSTEGGLPGSWTYTELRDEVALVARGLSASGVSCGDRVGIQLPMRPEAAVTQLALAWLGAIAVPIFSGFGAAAVADRLRASGATALVVAGGVTRRGRTHDLSEQTSAVTALVPGLELCVMVGAPGPRGREGGPLVVAWEEIRERGAGLAPSEPLAVDADHPLMIAFTSGTTGAPKGVTLGTAGFTIKSASDAALLFDIGPGDRACWFTDPGWVMHPITLIGGLVAGAGVALVDGAPDHPHPWSLWDTVDTLKLTMLGVSPTLVRGLMAAGGEPRATPNALRTLASSGEPWTDDAYAWLFEVVGRERLPIINYSGGTEVSGGILSNTVVEPIVPCAFAGPVPGMGAQVRDADGHAVEVGAGELALDVSSPGMPLGFWGEPGRYESTYWSRWPGRWHHGDWVQRTAAGPWFVHGRSDDTLKIAGKRLGPAEIENVANLVPGVLESVAIGVADAIKGSAIVIFVRLAPTASPSEVCDAVVEQVTTQLGKPLRPSRVLAVEDLPRTRSGKLLRRLVHDVHVGREVDPNQPSLANPGSLDALRGAR